MNLFKTISAFLIYEIVARDLSSPNSAQWWLDTSAGEMSRSCMFAYAIIGVRSIYDKDTKDRSWWLRCGRASRLKTTHECQWTYDYLNGFREPLGFKCPDDSYISGIYSHYNEKYRDRRFSIECCGSRDVKMNACIDTDWANEFDGELVFNLPKNKLLHGIYSYYSQEYMLGQEMEI